MQEVTVGLLKGAMVDNSQSVGYLIDGFPRELEQGELFKQQVDRLRSNYVCYCVGLLV